MASQIAAPAGEHVPTADQRLVTYGVPWSHFEAQLALRGERPVPRIAFLDGALELMSPSKDHERIKRIGKFIRVRPRSARNFRTRMGLRRPIES